MLVIGAPNRQQVPKGQGFSGCLGQGPMAPYKFISPHFVPSFIFYFPFTVNTIMSGVRPFPRKTAAAIAVVGVVGLCAARKASLRNEAFAESPKPCGGPGGLRGRGGPGRRMGFHTMRLESSIQVNDNTKRLRFQLPDPAWNAGLSLTCTLLCASTNDK